MGKNSTSKQTLALKSLSFLEFMKSLILRYDKTKSFHIISCYCLFQSYFAGNVLSNPPSTIIINHTCYNIAMIRFVILPSCTHPFGPMSPLKEDDLLCSNAVSGMLLKLLRNKPRIDCFIEIPIQI